MKQCKRETSLKDCLKAFVSLDCRSLPVRVNGNTSTAGMERSKAGKIASVASIRALLVFFGNLQANLNGILKSEDLSQFYDNRKPLIEKVIPDSVFAFEFCRSTLAMKGATDSPIAAKLATIANDVGDCIELLKRRVGIAMEYHELKYNVMADIREFVKKDEFSMADAEPLMFSLTVGLPSRIDSFASNASEHQTQSVDELYNLSIEVTEEARMKIDELKRIDAFEKHLSPSTPDAIKEKSPFRPKLEVLRGVKVRQPLKHFHKRVSSLRDIECKEPALNSDLYRDKENIGAYPNLQKVTLPEDSAKIAPKPEDFRGTRLKPPTKIENRKLVHPQSWSRRNSMDSSSSVSSISSHSSAPDTSKISRPTEIRPRCSRTKLNQTFTNSYTPTRRLCSSSTPRHTSSRSFDLRFTSFGFQSPKMQLASPGLAFEETPLTKKHTSWHGGPSAVSQSELKVQRIRPV